jgi:SAM-dependent methyltransferase
MSACFALLGAQAVGIDTDAEALKKAEREAQKWGVQSRVSFFHYDGDLDHCHALDNFEFDVVFTKSVLVLLGSCLPDHLEKLDRRLKQGGKCIFVENRAGGALFSLLRQVWPPSRKHYHGVTYLTPAQLKIINRVFRITHVKATLLPPVYLIVAGKRPA